MLTWHRAAEMLYWGPGRAHWARLGCLPGYRHVNLGVTLYALQVALLDRLTKERGLPGVECLTVDKCQGRDKDCVVVSFVRSNAQGEAGEWREACCCRGAQLPACITTVCGGWRAGHASPCRRQLAVAWPRRVRRQLLLSCCAAVQPLRGAQAYTRPVHAVRP